MPNPLSLCVVLNGGERQLKEVQHFEGVFQELAVGGNLCKINIEGEIELPFTVEIGDGHSIDFCRVFKTSDHSVGTVAKGEIQPCWELAFFVEKQRLNIERSPVGYSVVVFDELFHEVGA